MAILPEAGIQSFAFNCASFAAMNDRMSADMSSSFSHCSLYKVTGKRPIPLTFMRILEGPLFERGVFVAQALDFSLSS